jgi:cytoskeletal protein RodZ
MGTLGQYLREAREERGVDIRDAAQQTRISIRYLKALEDQDFAKLPGDVFVRGFLKSYGKFLQLDEAELMARYGELKPKPEKAAADSGVAASEKQPAVVVEHKPSAKVPVEPFLWAAGILVVLIVFTFVALSAKKQQVRSGAAPLASSQTTSIPVVASKPEKLYLEVVALEDTWLLVRTDTSPQKKAVLKKGETLTWSADERFQLSFGSANAVKLSLNAKELTLNEPRNTVVRDLIVTATGIVSKKTMPEVAKPKRKPLLLTQPTGTAVQKPLGKPQQAAPAGQQPQRTQLNVVPQVSAASPTTQPAVPQPQSRPTATR